MSTATVSNYSAGNARAFSEWANVYDRQENTLLVLEERYLKRILPDITGKHVLDIGCGTGRWLEHLIRREQPATLCGLDASSEMLQVARNKKFSSVTLVQTELPSLPIPSDTIDLVIASFVLSYVDNLQRCAHELARVVRESGDLFISDMHPETAATLGWTRGFTALGHKQELKTARRSISEIEETLAAHGFFLVASYEPSFGDKESELFRSRGKTGAFQRATGMPAIYILQFQKRRLSEHGHVDTDCALYLHGAHCAIGTSEMLCADISVHSDKIASINDRFSMRVSRPTKADEIDLTDYILFPGLINSHDHLEFALFPRLGNPPYENATEWALDIQEREASTISLHKLVPKECRLWWGALRNLLCGVTTVCHHNPLNPVLLSEDFPVRVISKYGWEHSVAFAKDVSHAVRQTGIDEPFIIHACEGTDQVSAVDLQILDSLGAIEQRSVLIHGLALESEGIALLNERRASLIVCPSSNKFLFGKTHTREQLRSIQQLALGSDSPLTAAGNLLDEVRFMKSECDMESEEVYELVTDRPATILRLRRGEGTLRPKAIADLIAVRYRNDSPSRTLTSLSWRDVELVITGGRIRLASTKMFERLPVKIKQQLNPLTVEDTVRWLSAPVSVLYEAAEKVLGKGNVRLGGLRVSPVEV